MTAASPGLSPKASERSCSCSIGSESSRAALVLRCARSLGSMLPSARWRSMSVRSGDFCCSARSQRSASRAPSRRFSSRAAAASAAPSRTRPRRDAATAATTARAAEIAQNVRLRPQRLRALCVLVEQGFLALVQGERPVVTARAGEQPPCSLEVRPVLRIEQERVLVADRGALRIAELIDVDAAHCKVHLRRRRGGPERADLRFELCQRIPGGADVRIRRLAFRDRNRELLGRDGVHASPNRTRPLPVQSASARRKPRLAAPAEGRSAATLERKHSQAGYEMCSRPGPRQRAPRSRSLRGSPAPPRCPCAAPDLPPCAEPSSG